MELLHVEGIPVLRKDAHSGGVINTDIDALEAARRLKAKKLQEIENVKNLEAKVERLEAMLNQLLEGMNNDK